MALDRMVWNPDPGWLPSCPPSPSATARLRPPNDSTSTIATIHVRIAGSGPMLLEWKFSCPAMFPAIRREFWPMLRLAIPVVLAELGWMSMGVVDTIMVGPLGPQAISAAGVGNAMHIAFAIFGMAVMLGLDTLVSQAFGARDIRECHRLFFDGLSLAGLMALPLLALLAAVWFAIPSLGFHEAVEPLLESYFGIAILSTPLD